MLDVQQTIEDTKAAVEFLKTHDWGQGQDYDPLTERYCAFGAVRAVVGGLVVDEVGFPNNKDIPSLCPMGSDEQTEALRRRNRAGNVGRAFYRIIGEDIVRYNDDYGRTKEQAIRALETVAAELGKDPGLA
jgi:hypothetical protein